MSRNKHTRRRQTPDLGAEYAVVNIRYYRKNNLLIPNGAVLVDRTTKWGNHKYKIGRDGDRFEVVGKFWADLKNDLEMQEKARNELGGHAPLVCWCHFWDGVAPTPGYCHADYWYEVANS